jgi:hypothetical protein
MESLCGFFNEAKSAEDRIFSGTWRQLCTRQAM